MMIIIRSDLWVKYVTYIYSGVQNLLLILHPGVTPGSHERTICNARDKTGVNYKEYTMYCTFILALELYSCHL